MNDELQSILVVDKATEHGAMDLRGAGRSDFRFLSSILSFQHIISIVYFNTFLYDELISIHFFTMNLCDR